MNGKALSEALGTLPEDMVAEAMEPARAVQRFSWLRLAACFAVIIGLLFCWPKTEQGIVTAPGILTVQVYAVDENSDTGFTIIDLKEGVTWLNEISWNLGWNLYPGLPIRLSLESDDFPANEITFEIQVSKGLYFEWGEHTDFRFFKLSQEFTQENFTTIYWSMVFDDTSWLSPEYDQIYTDIIIKCEGNIIGYSLLRFDRHEDPTLADTYTPYYVTSVLFPKLNGQYQNVTYEYVKSQMMEKE